MYSSDEVVQIYPMAIIIGFIFISVVILSLMWLYGKEIETLMVEKQELEDNNHRLLKLQDVVAKTAAYNQARYASCEEVYEYDTDQRISYIEYIVTEYYNMADYIQYACESGNPGMLCPTDPLPSPSVEQPSEEQL